MHLQQQSDRVLGLEMKKGTENSQHKSMNYLFLVYDKFEFFIFLPVFFFFFPNGISKKKTDVSSNLITLVL